MLPRSVLRPPPANMLRYHHAVPRLSAQMGTYPCLQLRKGEGLHNIVIPASRKPLYLIHILYLGSKEKDGAVDVVPDAAADLQPV